MLKLVSVLKQPLKTDVVYNENENVKLFITNVDCVRCKMFLHSFVLHFRHCRGPKFALLLFRFLILYMSLENGITASPIVMSGWFSSSPQTFYASPGHFAP